MIYYRPQNPKRRNLVILRAGDTSIHRQWIDQHESCDRNWDFLISYYGSDDTLARTFEEILIRQGSYKYNAIYELLHKYEILWNYSNFWLPDDDVLLSWPRINRLFDVFDEFQLLLAQPGVSPDSFSAHRITMVDERFVLRFTTFVEVMAPLFSAEALKRLVHTFEGAVTSWGLDYVWPHLLDLPRNRIAIIDEVVMKHTRQIFAGGWYDRPTADAEVAANLAKYGVAGPLQRIWGGIFKE